MRASPQRDLWSFLEYVRGECAYSNVKLKIEARRRTRAGDLGFFDETARVLFVCTDVEGWAMTLAHELGHLQQYRERFLAYRQADLEAFEEKLMGGQKKMDYGKLRNLTRAIQRCELDAERRALRLARVFHLTDDLEKYTRQANRYVWSYEVARQVGIPIGKWPKRSEDLRELIDSQMPTRLITQAEFGKPPPIIKDSLDIKS